MVTVPHGRGSSNNNCANANNAPCLLVPAVAAQWMATFMKSDEQSQQSLREMLSNPLPQSPGLLLLTCKELRAVCSALEHCRFNCEHLPSHKMMRNYKGRCLKRDLAHKIRNALYEDFPTCHIPNSVAMNELAILTTGLPNYIPPPAAATALTAAPTATAAAPPAPTAAPPATAPHYPPQNQVPPPNCYPVVFGSNGAFQPYGWANFPTVSTEAAVPPPPAVAVAQPIHNNYNNNTTTNTMAAVSLAESATASAAGGVVKTETPDFETTPQTAHEAVVLHQLRQMGFPVQDTAEILAAYRQLHDERSSQEAGGSSSTAAAVAVAPTADDVLLLAVGQRERHAGERLLAADMDRARLASERSRDDAAQRRAQIQQDRELQLERDSLASWMAQAFVHSWILHENNSNKNVFQPYISQGPPTPLKRRLLKLLQLERSARQWYQERLPRAYFVNVVLDRLQRASTCPTTLLQQVDTEIHQLECGMYELQRQVGGVPIIFRDALDANPDDDENRHEDVLLIQTMDRGSSASPWLTSTFSPSKKSSKKNCPNSAPKPVEVIELL